MFEWQKKILGMEFHESPEKSRIGRLRHMLKKRKLIRSNVFDLKGNLIMMKLCGSNTHHNWLQPLPRAPLAACLHSQFSSPQNLIKSQSLLCIVLWTRSTLRLKAERFESLSTSDDKTFHYPQPGCSSSSSFHTKISNVLLKVISYGVNHQKGSPSAFPYDDTRFVWMTRENWSSWRWRVSALFIPF